MKRIFFSIAVLCTCLLSQAQTEFTTYSSCDTNTNGEVNVEDVTNTTNKVLQKTASETNVVTAEQLNTILSEINTKLDKLEETRQQVLILKKCLSSLAEKEGTLTPEAIEEEAKYNGHDYVDLGLSVKWATCNIGATNPEDYGLYFAWGETTGYTSDTSDGHSFDFANYKWMASGQSSWQYCTKYTCEDGVTSASWYSNGTYVGTTVNGVTYTNKTTLDKEDDAAYVNWGGSWRMPTDAELTELRTKCTWTWTTESGVKGYKVTGTNGNYIFLPAAGFRYDTNLSHAGSIGCYWSSSLITYSSDIAYGLGFESSDVRRYDNTRYGGRSVRPVCQ